MVLAPIEIGLVLVLIVFLFGAQKLPELANGIGRATKEHERGRQADNEEEN